MYTLQSAIHNYNEVIIRKIMRFRNFALSSDIFGQNMSSDVIFLNLVLIFLYFYLFGWNSLMNYLEGGVIIKRNTAAVRTTDIKQPGNQDLLKHTRVSHAFVLIFQEL